MWKRIGLFVVSMAGCGSEGPDRGPGEEGGPGDRAVEDAAPRDSGGDARASDATSAPDARGDTETTDGAVARPDAVAGPLATGLEGYGAATTGGDGGELCHVTHTGNDGPGSLRACIADRSIAGGAVLPRVVVFDVAGTIVLESQISLRTPYLTVDGSTAPPPGITILKENPATTNALVVSTGGADDTHDIIVRHLRLDGEWNGLNDHNQNSGNIGIDGEDHPAGVHHVVFDHLTVLRSSDSGADMWGEVKDVTVSWCLFAESLHPMTLSHSGATQTRQRLSLHHNVFAHNHERNPQVRGRVIELDFVNNVVFEWQRFDGGYGMRLRERDGVYPEQVNVLNNFFASAGRPSAAIIYGDAPGSSDDGPSGMYPGAIYLEGNRLPPENVDDYSTASAFEVPADARVTTWATSELDTEMLPNVGMLYPTAEETALLTEIAEQIAAE